MTPCPKCLGSPVIVREPGAYYRRSSCPECHGRGKVTSVEAAVIRARMNQDKT